MNLYKDGTEKTPIAVVGIGCRMPGGVSNPQEFWDVLINGRDMITDIPPDRWSNEAFHDSDQSNYSTMVTKRCGFIHDVDKFDNTFFKISPREAASMDPQQRHILEVTYEAFQDAGIIPEAVGKSCGVYIGVGMMDYAIMIMDTSLINPYTHTGIGHSAIANRISYAFNLQGPSTVVDTACASSVTAMHMACCAIRNGECSTAVAGGCNSLLIPEKTVGFSALGVLSPEGKCCPFSDTAKGYVRSEGWGTFILKPLNDALENNDHVYAVIRGSAIGANGFSKSLTMPSAQAQQTVIENAYKRSDIPISLVSYVEAHGTGTPVGDPIEAGAIGAAFGSQRSTPIKIGSVKSNFGHNECAAGITAAIKVALMLQNKRLVPTINFNKPNPAIDTAFLNIQVQTNIEEIKDEQRPYTIGLNSFGFAGAVAHMVFQQAPINVVKPLATCGWSFGVEYQSEGKSIIIPLSAKTPEALKGLATKWLSFSCEQDALSVSSWQATRRDHYPCRMAVIANSSKSFCNTLTSYIREVGSESHAVGAANLKKPKICFVFPGQGQQWINMGRILFQEEQVFHDTILESDRLFKELSGWSILDSCGLFGSRDIKESCSPFRSAEEAINQIVVIQPAIIFIQVGMYHLLRHWGVEPDVVVGHSLGEVAAAYASGGLTLKEAIAVIYHRSHAQAKLTGTGRMAAFKASVEEARYICQQHQNVYIAAVNSPGAITLAGDSDEIEVIVAENPGKAKQLRATCAFHTPEMDPLMKPYKQAMEGVITSKQIKRHVLFYSTVTGHYYQGDFNTQYWWDNIRNPVMFQSAVQEILEDNNIDIFLEVSASATLLSYVKQIVRTIDPQCSIPTITTCLREKNDLHYIKRAVCSLYVLGVDIDWNQVTKNSAEWAPIPTYQWQHQSFWLETEERQKCRLGLDDRSFKAQNGKITLLNFPFLADHVVDTSIIFPGAGYVEYIAQMAFDNKNSPEMREVNFIRVLPWPIESDTKKGVIYLNFSKEGENVQIECEGNVYCTAIVNTKSDRESKDSLTPIERILKKCDKEVTKKDFYRRMQRIGFKYGPKFQVVEKAFMGDGESLAYLSPIINSNQRVSIPHLDATFQLALASIGPSTSMYLPVHIVSLHMTKTSLPVGRSLLVHTRIIHSDSNRITADMTLSSDSGEILIEVKGFQAQGVHSNQSDVDIDSCVYTTQWQPTSACTLSPSVIIGVFDESHLNTTYSGEMDAIQRAEEVLNDIEGVCASYIRNALEKVPEKHRRKGQSYDQYIALFKKIASLNTIKYIPFDEIPEVIEKIYKHCPELDAELSLTKNLGEALPETLRDPQVAVPIMFSSEGLDRYFYDSLSTRIHYKAVAEAINKIVVEGLKYKCVVRILELGARIGGLTRFILEHLKEFGLTNQLEYVFTDVSATFFRQAQDNLEIYPFIQYKQLNIEQDISVQGFVSDSFDVVICLDTLHAAVDVQRSTSYISKLLTQDGLMFIIEGTNTHLWTELWFGTLDVCWVFNDLRKEKCWMNRQSWTDVMRKIGLQQVTSASTPNEFIHSVSVGRKHTNIDRQVYTAKKKRIEKAQPAKLMIVREINNTFVEEIKSAYQGIVDIRSFSDVKSFGTIFHDHTLAPMEVMYIYNDTDVALHALLKLLQAVEQYPQSTKRVWVLTKGANNKSANINGSLVIGLVRSVTNYISNVPIYSVDFDATCSLMKDVNEVMRLFEEPYLSEREIVIRESIRYVPRMTHQQLKASKIVSTHWRVEQATSQKGNSRSIDNLTLHDINKSDIQPDKVKIRVRAAPLNFKDVMMAMGLLEGLDSEVHPSFGIECAGVVEEIGTAVNSLKVGEEVVAFGKQCFASHVICDAKLTTLRPRNLSWTESASIGVVFVTAYFSLVERANLQKGETVLIHSACGGVGLAAIQIARLVGASVICTAGTEEKRTYLRDVLGIEFVCDSRSTKFHNDIMSFTKGRGVDVVLNSLSGELLSTSMSLLASGGRFCEIGKRDILQNSSIPMRALLENKSFISCQVDILMRERPMIIHRLMQKVVSLFESNTLHPIPTTVYSIRKFREAFRFMSKGWHIGKICFHIENDFIPAEVRPSLQQFSSTATYIISGGYGGIGQTLARWLCDTGAKHIVFVSRSGAKTAAARRLVRYLRVNDVTVHQFQIDISDYSSVKCMLENLRDDKTVPPFKGIFHLAGIIEEEHFSEITQEQMHRILGAKAVGAHNLHTLTINDDLDVFFLLSSISAVFGHSGQPVYCAANNYLDALAEQRHSEGLPALSIQLGAVRGAGYLEGNEDLVKVMAMRGILQIHVDEFLHVLGRLLQQNDLPVVCLANQDWGLTQQSCHRSMLKFHHLVSSSQATNKHNNALTNEDKENGIKSKMADLLCMPVDAIDVKQPMINYGVDSLVALEIVNWATNQLGVTISQLDILSGLTTAAILQRI